MAFWTSQANNVDPKRGFRFKIIFGGFDADSSGIVWWAKKVTKPGFQITEAKHAFLNHSFYYPGRVEWQEITMTLVDPVSPGAVAQTNLMVEASGYKIPKDGTNLGSMSKKKSAEALGAIEIIQIDGNGDAIETWSLKQAFIKNVKYGELSYEDDNLTEIELTLRYDWATCTLSADGKGNLTPIDGSQGLNIKEQFGLQAT